MAMDSHNASPHYWKSPYLNIIHQVHTRTNKKEGRCIYIMVHHPSTPYTDHPKGLWM